MPRSPFADDRQRFAAGRHGLWLFLASLSMLFAASVVGFVVIRLNAHRIEGLSGWPDDLPPLPRVLWLSTLVLAASSVAIQSALVAARRGRRGEIAAGMLVTLVLAGVFLGLQAGAAWSWRAALGDRAGDDNLLRFAASVYYVLTGLHAAHVLGGLVPMLFVTRRGLHGRYTADAHAGVFYCALYWHFLGVVWLCLFGALLIGL